MSAINLRKSQLLSLVAIVIILGLVYWLDTVQISWHRQASQTFNMKPFLYFTFALPVVFAVLIIFLSWLLLVHFKPMWVTLIFCLLIGAGLVGLAFSLVAVNPILSPIVNSMALTGLRRVIFDLGSGSITLQAGAFVSAIGLINLIRILVTPPPRA